MVRQRTGTMLRDFQAMLEQRDMTIDAYLQATGVEAATLEKDITEQAAQSAKEDLALEALFRAKGMEVTDADIDEELKTVADGTESTPEEARARWEEMGLLPVITEQIMHLKAVGWLMENATVTQTTDVDAAASDEE
jgi:trigger factor